MGCSGPSRSRPEAGEEFGGAASEEAAQEVELLFVRHAVAMPLRERIGPMVDDPALGPAGAAQAAALVDRLAAAVGQSDRPVLLYSSPMLRCLLTAAPAAAAHGVTPRVHASLYEYQCCGTELVGSSEEQVTEALAQAGVPEVRCTGFAAGGCRWGYAGQHPKERTDEFLQRAFGLADWIKAEVLPEAGGMSRDGRAVVVVVAHQTLLDLLIQLLVDGNERSWRYGRPKFKMGNTDIIAVTKSGTDFKVTQHYKAAQVKRPMTERHTVC